MSHFPDDDDDDSDNNGKIGFVCENCGSTDYYEDDINGICCSSCFTQSQQFTMQAEIEMDDLLAMGSRNRGGAFANRRIKRSTGEGRARKELETFDQSVPIPTLDDCLDAYKEILQNSIKVLSSLLELDKEQTKDLRESVRRIWVAYLFFWREGAEFYGKLHPEVRFSLRDAFFAATMPIHQIVMHHASHNAAETIRKEMKETGSIAPPEEPEESGLTGRSITATPHVATLLRLYRRKGKREAALSMKPSMPFTAALLLAATASFGVAPYKMVSFIQTGELPLMFAYTKLLSKETQGKTKPIATFFTMVSPLGFELLQQNAHKLLGIALTEGVVPSKISCLFVPTTNALVSMLKLLVDDLCFPVRVLHSALALLGLYEGDERELPDRLVPASKIREIQHLLGVVVVAVKSCPCWEEWDLMRKARFIPSNQAQLSAISEPDIPPYLDFLANFFEKDRDKAVLRLHDDIEEEDAEELEKRRKSATRVTVISGRAPHEPSVAKILKQPPDYRAWKLLCRTPKAVLADANGFGEYIVYPPATTFPETHPHYRVLLEHIVCTVRHQVSASQIHQEVLMIDQKLLESLGLKPDSHARVLPQRKTGKAMLPHLRALQTKWKELGKMPRYNATLPPRQSPPIIPERHKQKRSPISEEDLVHNKGFDSDDSAVPTQSEWV